MTCIASRGPQPAADLSALVERFFGIAWRGLDPTPEPLPASRA